MFDYPSGHLRTDVLPVVNPLLTIAFDLFVIAGSAGLFALAILQGRAERRGAVAAARPFRGARIEHRPRSLSHSRRTRRSAA
jgi:hypothetical protein